MLFKRKKAAIANCSLHRENAVPPVPNEPLLIILPHILSESSLDLRYQNSLEREHKQKEENLLHPSLYHLNMPYFISRF